MSISGFGRLAAITLGIAVCCAGSIHAAPRDRIVVKVQYYDISGSTPRELFMSMLKRGPKDGLRSRAIAQTEYHTDWDTALRFKDGVCRVTRAEPRANITYIYPRLPREADATAKKRWEPFSAGIKRHERQHGRYVREMLATAKKAVVNLQTKGDEDCRRTSREMKRLVRAMHDRYEEMQRDFDVREHRDGATIDRLIRAFVRK